MDELREVVIATGADTVICDGELAAAQLRNLEDRIQIKVIDRTALILDIFAAHAKSAEGKAQVELAQLQYLRQRLQGWGGNPVRPAVAPAAALASAAAVQVRRSWRLTGAGSPVGSPSYAPSCATWTRLVRSSALSGGAMRCRRWRSSSVPTPASRAC